VVGSGPTVAPQPGASRGLFPQLLPQTPDKQLREQTLCRVATQLLTVLDD
jgi:hypothetical protein